MPMALWMNEQFFNSASGESYETDNSAIDLSNVAGVCAPVDAYFGESDHRFRSYLTSDRSAATLVPRLIIQW
jgi:hypothetical protein